MGAKTLTAEKNIEAAVCLLDVHGGPGDGCR